MTARKMVGSLTFKACVRCSAVGLCSCPVLTMFTSKQGMPSQQSHKCSPDSQAEATEQAIVDKCLRQTPEMSFEQYMRPAFNSLLHADSSATHGHHKAAASYLNQTWRSETSEDLYMTKGAPSMRALNCSFRRRLCSASSSASSWAAYPSSSDTWRSLAALSSLRTLSSLDTYATLQHATCAVFHFTIVKKCFSVTEVLGDG